MTHALRELLLPQTTILTPSSLEARTWPAATARRARLASAPPGLIESGCEFVLVTCTHAFAAGGQHHVRQERHRALGQLGAAARQLHGSGCTLASAIAAMLANGLELPEAVREAQDYTWQALAKAYRPGMGQFLPDRMFWAREESEARGDAAEASRVHDMRGSH